MWPLPGRNCVSRAILNKSWRQHPTRHQLYGHLPLITKTIQGRRTRHAGYCWRSRDELIRDVLLWTPTHGRAKQRHEHTFSSYVRIRDVVLKTYLGRWTIGRSGERGSGISVLPARYDDDDDDIYMCVCNKGWDNSERTYVENVNREKNTFDGLFISQRVSTLIFEWKYVLSKLF